MNKIAGVGALLAMTSVILGAFGAHKLRGVLSVRGLEVFEIGVRYQLIHAVALVLIGLLVEKNARHSAFAGWLMVGGILIFSGSMYLVALAEMTWFGRVAPVGGMMLVASWAVLAKGMFSKH